MLPVAKAAEVGFVGEQIYTTEETQTRGNKVITKLPGALQDSQREGEALPTSPARSGSWMHTRSHPMCSVLSERGPRLRSRSPGHLLALS